jgi:nucleoid DNA-binding protein
MTKSELIKSIAHQTGLDPTDVKTCVEATLANIVLTLEAGNEVSIRNFGRFFLKHRKTKKARNMQTGETIEVPGRFVLGFQPAKEFEDRIRNAKIPKEG